MIWRQPINEREPSICILKPKKYIFGGEYTYTCLYTSIIYLLSRYLLYQMWTFNSGKRWGIITDRRSSHLRVKTDRRRYRKTYGSTALGIHHISPVSGVATAGSDYKLCNHSLMMMIWWSLIVTLDFIYYYSNSIKLN